ncbi:biotin transport system ATP-binding protein [Nakamurella panacisegetis]|uniref:Biotin transport system ATP-binding protein n=1 Tax=Nakamurella panacisegetis TaxID=1090615 RepID=A0A1H0NIG9_9ACTN|nr:ABC transporter ATP-binding protein [Nakamurella panacisegetis]SDO92494.1 biotin transport system ATP-binding protein [Nakamurella panacisegetis]
MPRIEFVDVEVTVPIEDGDLEILRRTSLVLSEHRIGVIGANGSGKSTLARLINSLVEPTRGTVAVDGLSTSRDAAAVRRRVGFVFTDPAAQLVMPTVVEDVQLSLRRSHSRRSERQRAALAVLDRYGLAALAHRSVHTLSGGQRQLLAMAGVLATDPAILVADEPTTLLDLGNTRMIGDLLFSLPQQLILLTHDLDLARRCDRVLVVADGRVVFDGDAGPAVESYIRSVEGIPVQDPA